jgi:hypothetical protein
MKGHPMGGLFCLMVALRSHKDCRRFAPAALGGGEHEENGMNFIFLCPKGLRTLNKPFTSKSNQASFC